MSTRPKHAFEVKDGRMGWSTFLPSDETTETANDIGCTCRLQTRASTLEMYGMRFGAHEESCAIYRVSGDPVDAKKDIAHREAIMARQTTETTARHTPGPWSVRDISTNVPQMLICKPAECGGEGIAIIRLADYNRDRIEANARLIAAAPTMYNYLELLAQRGDDEARKIIENAR